jgi:hypothetical protein
MKEIAKTYELECSRDENPIRRIELLTNALVSGGYSVTEPTKSISDCGRWKILKHERNIGEIFNSGVCLPQVTAYTRTEEGRNLARFLSNLELR